LHLGNLPGADKVYHAPGISHPEKPDQYLPFLSTRFPLLLTANNFFMREERGENKP
jgi:hypothetical protein